VRAYEPATEETSSSFDFFWVPVVLLKRLLLLVLSCRRDAGTEWKPAVRVSVSRTRSLAGLTVDSAGQMTLSSRAVGSALGPAALNWTPLRDRDMTVWSR
jgi:hypothetical protein